MTKIVKIRIITSEYEKLKSYMKTWPYFYEITEGLFNEIMDPKVYYIKMDVGYCLDIDFLIDLKKFTKGRIAIDGNPEELP